MNDFNIRFFIPIKDQCTNCNSYYEATDEEKAKLKPEWEEHKRRERESMDAKEADKSRAKSDKSFVSVTFDLQDSIANTTCRRCSDILHPQIVCI